MWTNLKNFYSTLLKCAESLTYSKRTTYVLERLREPRLNPLGAKYAKKYKRREFYYRVVEHNLSVKSPTTELLLLKDVPGMGMAGDKIEVNRYAGYRDFILPKIAVYTTSLEALTEISEKKQFSSMFSKIVENYLSTISIPVFLSYDTKWTLEQWHVKTALRKQGISASEDCITLPSVKISGPNPDIENRDFLVQVTMNKSEIFDVRCRIFHWSQRDRTLNQRTIDMISPSEPLFPEQSDIINALIKNEKEFKKFQSIKATSVPTKSKKKKFY